MTERTGGITMWHLRAALGAFSLLVLGFLAGFMTDRALVAVEGRHAVPAIATPDDETLRLFREVLQLEDSQMGQIHEILLANQAQVDQAWQSLRVEIHEGVERVHTDIRALLTEEQLDMFERWLDQHVRIGPEGVESHVGPHEPGS